MAQIKKISLEAYIVDENWESQEEPTSGYLGQKYIMLQHTFFIQDHLNKIEE